MHQLGQYIGAICIPALPCNSHHLRCLCFTRPVISNCIVFLLDCQFWKLAVLEDRFVVTIYASWSGYRDPHHTQLVAQCFDLDDSCFHCNEFGPKCWWLDCILSLWIPYYWCTLNIDQNARMWSTGHTASSMIRITVTCDGSNIADKILHKIPLDLGDKCPILKNLTSLYWIH
jgi:hypothetical protein